MGASQAFSRSAALNTRDEAALLMEPDKIRRSEEDPLIFAVLRVSRLHGAKVLSFGCGFVALRPLRWKTLLVPVLSESIQPVLMVNCEQN